jgi:hypothetical protein
LFPLNIKIEELIQQTGIGLEGLNQSLESHHVPHVFRQLFRGLEREKDLFVVSQYRDHFIHSFYVFVMGLIFLKSKSNKILPDKLILNSKNEKEILKKWFIISMCHDIAYVLEKGESILEKYVLNFISEPKRKKNVLPWIPRLGNLMQIERLLDNIDDITFEKVISLKKCKGLKNRDFIIPIAFQHINHGIWSSLFVFHSLEQKELVEMFKSKENKCKEQRLEICRAILPHHISQWEVDKFLSDFSECKINNKWKDIAYIDSLKNPLGYLLSLCDTLCQAGREAPELAIESNNPSKLKIKFSKINIIENSIEIGLHYEQNGSQNLSEYYTKPFEFLKIINGNSNEYGLKINLSLNDENPLFFKLKK